MPRIGSHVRVHYSRPCHLCDGRDPQHTLEGKTGVVVSLIEITFIQHWYEVRFDDGSILKDVPVPKPEEVAAFYGVKPKYFVDLDEPNFAAYELVLL